MQVPHPKKDIALDVTRVPGLFSVLLSCLVPALCRKNFSCVYVRRVRSQKCHQWLWRERGHWSALPNMGNPSEWDWIKDRNHVLYLLAGGRALLHIDEYPKLEQFVTHEEGTALAASVSCLV